MAWEASKAVRDVGVWGVSLLHPLPHHRWHQAIRAQGDKCYLSVTVYYARKLGPILFITDGIKKTTNGPKPGPLQSHFLGI